MGGVQGRPAGSRRGRHARRGGRRRQPGKGKVSAKTGTLIWSDAANERFLLKSKALAGTMTTKDGTPLYFAMFVNNVPLPDGVGSEPRREGDGEVVRGPLQVRAVSERQP